MFTIVKFNLVNVNTNQNTRAIANLWLEKKINKIFYWVKLISFYILTLILIYFS